MPYPRAHFALLALVPLIVLAFWPFYFSRLGASPWTMHVHGLTGTAWILLLIFQSWAIHNRRIAWHRLAGQGSLVLFPAFLAGGLLVLHTMARGLAEEARPFVMLYGSGLGLVDMLAVGTFAWLYYNALKHRRDVQLHARYMLATPLLLLMAIFARLFTMAGPLAIRGGEDLPRFVGSFHLSAMIVLGIALALYAGNRQHGRAFLVVAVVTGLQSAGFQWVGPLEAWRSLYAGVAGVPLPVTLIVGLAAGAGIAWAGWRGGGPSQRPQPLVEPAT